MKDVRSRVVLSASALALVLPATGLAQSRPDSAPNTATAGSVTALPGLVITATRNKGVEGKTPQKTTVITRDQIEQQQAISSDPGQVLSNLIPSYSPGRQKLSNAGETFRSRSPLFLVDGVPQSNPLRDSARDSYTIDLDMVERIEVIHGASAEHGLGATGGIINFVTRKPESGQINQSVTASVTTDDDVTTLTGTIWTSTVMACWTARLPTRPSSGKSLSGSRTCSTKTTSPTIPRRRASATSTTSRAAVAPSPWVTGPSSNVALDTAGVSKRRSVLSAAP